MTLFQIYSYIFYYKYIPDFFQLPNTINFLKTLLFIKIINKIKKPFGKKPKKKGEESKVPGSDKMCQGMVLCHTLILTTISQLIPKILSTPHIDKFDCLLKVNIKSSL